eukprot:1151260-Pelagomonas_calceolata.AAC.6
MVGQVHEGIAPATPIEIVCGVTLLLRPAPWKGAILYCHLGGLHPQDFPRCKQPASQVLELGASRSPRALPVPASWWKGLTAVLSQCASLSSIDAGRVQQSFFCLSSLSFFAA